MTDSIETAERWLRASGIPVTGDEIRAWLDELGIPVMVGVWPLFAAIRQAVIAAGDAGCAEGRRQAADAIRATGEQDVPDGRVVLLDREHAAQIAEPAAAPGSTLRAQAPESERCEHCGGELVLLAPKDTVKICRDCGVAAIRRRADRPVDLWLGPPRRDTVCLADLDLRQDG